MGKRGYVAFDLGAESGRAMLATLDRGKLTLEETHRFANQPVRLPSGLHWNLTGLWANLLEGLRKTGDAARRNKVKLVSLGVDTWGVDMGLVGASGQLLGLPFAYRDSRNPPAMKKAFRKLGQKAIYDATGIQFMALNTLYQLIAQHDAQPQPLRDAKRLLMIPDLLHYFFSGQAVNEATIASTTQMVDPRTGKWNKSLLKKLGLPVQMLGAIVPAGARIGTLRPELAVEAGVEEIAVIVPGSHDTASAVAAVPVDAATCPSWAYLSSGTWSLMGAELDAPIVTDASRTMGFTNERGVAGKIRFLKNIAGLWLLQEVRRDFLRAGKEYTYPQLEDMAGHAPAFRTLIDPGHAPFAAPGDMRAKIIAFAKATRQPAPRNAGEFARCCLESLALTYRLTLDGLEQLLERRIDALHIVGGGGRNGLLNQMTADALNRPVIVGPYEATATGNALTQALGAGDVKDLAHLRRIVRDSFDVLTITPRKPEAFEGQLPRFQALLGK